MPELSEDAYTMSGELPLDQILHGDSLAILKVLPADSLDLVFADPPYYLQLQQELWRPNMTRVDAVDEAWDWFEGFEAYDAFSRAWLLAVRRVMKDTATLWISGTYHNIFRVGQIAQDLGFWLLNTVIWFKPNAMPNFRGTRFKNDVEVVIWAARSADSRYTFNHHQMKQFNHGKQLGCVWEIPVCGGPERLRDESGKKLHPTQKPEELLRRIILASSVPGDVVLDPFVGTGTTAAVACLLHRHWIGIEREADYVSAARQRVAAVQPLDSSDPLLVSSSQHKPVRVPFKQLLAAGYVRPGQTLTLDHPAVEAIILEDGQVQTGSLTGSIHRVGAQLKEAPSCNGWKHWFYVDESSEQRRPIDVLRRQFRATLNK